MISLQIRSQIYNTHSLPPPNQFLKDKNKNQRVLLLLQSQLDPLFDSVHLKDLSNRKYPSIYSSFFNKSL